MGAHLSPVSTSAKEGSSASSPPELEARSVRIPKGNAALGCTLPPLPPPDAPRLPTRATLCLEGEQSYRP
eukprot:8800660-Pyramimonas_sp.AAC.1